MKKLLILVSLFYSALTFAGAHFDKVLVIVFENTSYDKALKQPFFNKFAKDGALLTNFYAVTNPSQGNYIAMTSGSFYGIRHDRNVTLDVRHIGDLLEDKGLDWKSYAEGYPGECFLGSTSGGYARKHVPFLSYKNVQTDRSRCLAHIFDEKAFDHDLMNGTLPEYSLYVPDLDNDGHDTGVAYASKWFEQKITPVLNNPALMKGLLIIATFDEGNVLNNHIYTALYADSIIKGTQVQTKLSHYSIIKLIEEEMGLADLGQGDVTANPISGIFKE